MRKTTISRLLPMLACLAVSCAGARGGEPPAPQPRPQPNPKLAERYLNEVYREEFRRSHEESRPEASEPRIPDFRRTLDSYDSYTRHQDERADRQHQYLEERNVMEDRLRRAPRGSETERVARQDLWDLYDRQARDKPLYEPEPLFPSTPSDGYWP